MINEANTMCESGINHTAYIILKYRIPFCPALHLPRMSSSLSPLIITTFKEEEEECQVRAKGR